MRTLACYCTAILLIAACDRTSETDGNKTIADAVNQSATQAPVVMPDSKSSSNDLVSDLPLRSSAITLPVSREISFAEVRDEAKGAKKIVLNPGEQTIVEASDLLVGIEAQQDFNGDSMMDALIWYSSGGTCCPETYLFITINEQGKIYVSPLDYEWAKYSIVLENGRPLVAQKTVASTVYWALEGVNAVKRRTVPALQTIAEISGEGAHYQGDLEKKVLTVDIDEDGDADFIVCGIWERWGSLVCELPLPNGKTQGLNIGCDRFGAMAKVTNGYHELVCNNDIMFVFDGNAWQVSEP